MQKASNPTSHYKVFCDTFDMVGTAKIDTDKKLNLSLESEDGKEKLSLSLFAEDVLVMAKFLKMISRYVKPRNTK